MPMRFRATCRRYWLAGAFLLVALATCSCDQARKPTSGRTSTIKFAQLTDPHLFDAGKPSKKQTRTEAEKESAETLEAFEWALKQLNEPENRGLDFVVITGDFGLEMVSISLRKKSAEYLAEELAKLNTVHTILLVSGNNDLLDESHEYIGVYNEFVDEVRSHLIAMGKNKAIVNLIKASHAPPTLGLVVVGLDSSTFRNKECGATVTQPPKPQCPALWDYQTEEMKRVQTVLWADEIAVEFAYQSLTVGVRGVLRKSWSAEVLVASLEQVASGELCFEKALSDQFLRSRRKAVTAPGGQDHRAARAGEEE